MIEMRHWQCVAIVQYNKYATMQKTFATVFSSCAHGLYTMLIMC